MNTKRVNRINSLRYCIYLRPVIDFLTPQPHYCNNQVNNINEDNFFLIFKGKDY